MRHCQSEFNRLFTLSRVDPGIADAPLSPSGQLHARQLAKELSALPIRRILVSPYTRALQTAAPIAAMFGLRPQIALLAREQCFFACDIGAPASCLAREWPEVDFSGLEEIWWNSGFESENEAQTRAQRFRTEMSAHEDHHGTLLISHWAFLRSFAGRPMANGSWIEIDPAAEVPTPPPIRKLKPAFPLPLRRH